jgi:hypothetical protein
LGGVSKKSTLAHLTELRAPLRKPFVVGQRPESCAFAVPDAQKIMSFMGRPTLGWAPFSGFFHAS